MIFHVAPVFGKMNRQRANWRNLRDQHPREYQLREHVQEKGDPVSSCGRELPKVKFVIDCCVGKGGTIRDKVMVTNSDSFLATDTLKHLSDLCYSRRVNGRTWPNWGVDSYTLRGKDHGFEGVDLVCFPIEWWYDNSKKIPDMYMGTECWDWVFKFMILMGGGKQVGPLVYHENHSPRWKQEMDSSREWNRACAYEWAREVGLNRMCAIWDNLETYRSSWEKFQGSDFYGDKS